MSAVTDAPTQAQLDEALAHYRAQQEQIDAAAVWCERALQYGNLKPAGTPREEAAFKRGYLKGRASMAFDVLMTLGRVSGGEGEK